MKLPGYVTPINGFIILGLFRSSSWSHKMLSFIQQPIGFENNTKQRSKNPKPSFPAFLIFKIFSSLGHVKLVLNFYVLEKWGSEQLSGSDVGHTANFSPFPPTNKFWPAKSLGLIGKSPTSWWVLDKKNAFQEAEVKKCPLGAKNQTEENEETWVSSVTRAGHNSGPGSPPLKQAA